MKEHSKKYKITNKINNHYYIGKRSCDCEIEDDPYMGSGTGLKCAFDKHGIENFEKTIISLHETWKDAYEAEALLVTKDIINSQECYNMKTGGLYGDYNFNQDVKDKISHTTKSNYSNLSELEKQERKNHLTRIRAKAHTKEANDKRRESCRISSTKYHHGRASKRPNHSAYNIWILENSIENTTIISYTGLSDLPIPNQAVYGRLKEQGIKDRKKEVTLTWKQGKRKHLTVRRMPIVCSI